MNLTINLVDYLYLIPSFDNSSQAFASTSVFPVLTDMEQSQYIQDIVAIYQERFTIDSIVKQPSWQGFASFMIAFMPEWFSGQSDLDMLIISDSNIDLIEVTPVAVHSSVFRSSSPSLSPLLSPSPTISATKYGDSISATGQFVGLSVAESVVIWATIAVIILCLMPTGIIAICRVSEANFVNFPSEVAVHVDSDDNVDHQGNQYFPVPSHQMMTIATREDESVYNV